MLQRIEAVLNSSGSASLAELSEQLHLPPDFVQAMVTQLKALDRIEEVGSCSSASSSCASSCGGCSFSAMQRYQLKQ